MSFAGLRSGDSPEMEIAFQVEIYSELSYQSHPGILQSHGYARNRPVPFNRQRANYELLPMEVLGYQLAKTPQQFMLQPKQEFCH